jgi:flagellar basal-body rod modification protein FlgD
MTSVTSTTNSTSTSTASGASSVATSTLTGDFNTFLTLLTTQMRNQDPLNPTDSTQFTQQLATYAGVEQQINTNTNLSTLISLQETQQNATATSYLGDRVKYNGGTISLQNGYSEFTYDLGANADSVTISIYDQDNNLVTSSKGSTSAGTYPMVWDGTDKDGNKVGDGVYTVKVAAFDTTKNAVDCTVTGSGEVTAVVNDNGTTKLQMGDGNTIALTDVTGVVQGSGMTSTETSAWTSLLSGITDIKNSLTGGSSNGSTTGSTGNTGTTSSTTAS